MKPRNPLNRFYGGTDLAVMRPFNYSPAGSVGDLQFSRWLAEFSPKTLAVMLLLACLWPGFALAQSGYTMGQAMDALERLGSHDAKMAQVVECRFFAGLTEQETADALGISLRSAQRYWTRARAWLREYLGSEPTAGTAVVEHVD